MWHLSVRPCFDDDAWDVNRSGISPVFHPARLPSYPYMKLEPGSEITKSHARPCPNRRCPWMAQWICPRIYI